MLLTCHCFRRVRTGRSYGRRAGPGGGPPPGRGGGEAVSGYGAARS
ncbi:hypothetical protein SLNWT_6356 [Streptomyces albus]|uniref:Uncharacterized protein n=1 Tax=Streptomyces albus (strain ATCC 21838 / DSM 41398 / FERM P-419 / JCM 4703 / NBRC 107858) TaxID=1081613 RepID=A0A0B5F8C7_STRA4|nr:hypothetical protein SLNWT_6356 [Streptomyces albus]AOU81036.1 hypothetical protein SLNHY_6345 [Streptomyces albus]AYN36738.1 hypothetical protein DUI70_6245 [Streptomyces albus]